MTAGYADDSALASRSDVLTFTSEPLTTELEVAGSPLVELGHSSDNPFADLFVRVSEGDAQGRSRNVSDGFVRLHPSAPQGLKAFFGGVETAGFTEADDLAVVEEVVFAPRGG
ncbi:CocE/NonD family hydrolase C-terminal non-catalytic domain-containing protein [Nonomuraea endophytica]|uniref:Putative acyl esterase n=1 Tax=Nonomuraea endophytica TaxID=714136 RepID=A0A7W8ACJ0_9ACTN|nr:CocE/NonD family hydrolase C-terminal non-catalytic domain-containing protein [Nonomuraea endophytica]MBB5083608.1 putative acyl esterase [Nonomuraea endophytica]